MSKIIRYVWGTAKATWDDHEARMLALIFGPAIVVTIWRGR